MEFANQWTESKMFMQDVVKAKEPFGELHFKGMHHDKDKDKEVGKQYYLVEFICYFPMLT